MRDLSSKSADTSSNPIPPQINPWEDTELLGMEASSRFMHPAVSSKPPLPSTAGREPHIFSVAREAYSRMALEGCPQSVLVTGESGSGKTVACGCMTQHLAALSALHSAPAGGTSPRKGRPHPMERQLLESSPVLESFGNAKTLLNDNSSRFAKFVSVSFDPPPPPPSPLLPRMRGGQVHTYLLERSRVTSVPSGERSFHVFYQLIAACRAASNHEARITGIPPGFLEGLGLAQEAAQHPVVGAGGCVSLEGVDDNASFGRTMRALDGLGMPGGEVASLLEALASILHLGSVEFAAGEEAPAAKGARPKLLDDPDRAHAVAGDALPKAAMLLGVEGLERALESRVVRTGGEAITVGSSVAQAQAARSSVCREVYLRLFNHLVDRVNASLLGGGGVEGAGEAARRR